MRAGRGEAPEQAVTNPIRIRCYPIFYKCLNENRVIGTWALVVLKSQHGGSQDVYEEYYRTVMPDIRRFITAKFSIATMLSEDD